jgi:hypothetical protein
LRHRTAQLFSRRWKIVRGRIGPRQRAARVKVTRLDPKRRLQLRDGARHVLALEENRSEKRVRTGVRRVRFNGGADVRERLRRIPKRVFGSAKAELRPGPSRPELQRGFEFLRRRGGVAFILQRQREVAVCVRVVRFQGKGFSVERNGFIPLPGRGKRNGLAAVIRGTLRPRARRYREHKKHRT